MIRHGRPHCNICGLELRRLKYNEHGDELWPWRSAHAHVCNPCFEEQWDREWKQDNPCRTMCETRPCEKGRDCWYTPPIMQSLPYETYYGERKPAKLGPGPISSEAQMPCQQLILEV